MNRRLVLVALVGAFSHSTLGMSIEAKDFKLKCRKADGHFGSLDVAASDDEYVINANEGYARNLATELRISDLDISKLKIKVPIKDCKLSETDAKAIECTSKDAKAEFDGNEKVELEPREFHLSVYTLVDVPKTKVRIEACGGRSVQVELDFDSPQGNCK